MSDLFDDLNKIFKKDIVPIFTKYFKDPNNKITDNLNDLVNDPQIILMKILKKFSQNKEPDNYPRNYSDIKNVIDIDPAIDDEYDNLLKRLILIEENMMHIERLLKDKN